MRLLPLAFLIAGLAVVAFAGEEAIPEQTRVGITGDGNFVITYTTGSSASARVKAGTGAAVQAASLTSNVYWGTSSTSLNYVAKGSSHLFTYDKYEALIHDVILSGLPSNTQIFYQVGDKAVSQGLSNVFSFNTAAPQTWAVYGDFGVTNMQSLDVLLEDAASNDFQGVLHVGDIAYDLHNAKGGRGDEFLNDVEPIAASRPYLFTVGNHEKEGNFTHYNHRFSAQLSLGQHSNSGTGLWYSFNQGLVHYVAINTEVWAYYPDEAQQARQMQWLKQDLAKANANRGKQPWVIGLGHKCDWQDEVDFSELRDVLYQGGVDLYICGHQHNYQRLFPGYRSKKVEVYDDPSVYTDPKHWAQIVVGSPGCQEKISSGLAPYKNGLAAYFLAYGYGLLRVYNATHLSWKWKQTHKAAALNGETPQDGRMISLHNSVTSNAGNPSIKDELLLIQHNHGPRNPI